MVMLNCGVCEVMLEVGVHVVTDVTGFGFCGHLRNMVVVSGCIAVVLMWSVLFLEAVVRYVHEGIVFGGMYANVRFLVDWVDFGDVSKEE